MTAEQIEIISALDRVTFLPGSFNKRLARNLLAMATNKPEGELSEKQNEWIYRLLYTYRRQIPVTYEKYKNHQYCQRLKR